MDPEQFCVAVRAALPNLQFDKRSLQYLFQQMDSNKDGMLDGSELFSFKTVTSSKGGAGAGVGVGGSKKEEGVGGVGGGAPAIKPEVPPPGVWLGTSFHDF